MNSLALQTLNVYLHGEYVGKLAYEEGSLSFTYDQSYLEKADAAKLSSSLPLSAHPFAHIPTAAFFSGLLPDETVRDHLAKYLNLSTKNTFALLKAIGGECAGAVALYPQGTDLQISSEPTYRILNEQEADVILCSLSQRPFLAGAQNIRISGAGAQNKLAIAFVNDQLAIPTGTTASTHFIKPAIDGLASSVHNEFFCMKLAKTLNLPVPKVEILWLMNKPYYVIERYDRLIKKDKLVIRLHQEDFCQALHIPPEIKYENEGGPTIKQCFSFLEQRIKLGLMSGKNKLILLKAIIFNYLIGNGDAHGKNFSILYQNKAEYLAPFYDLLSTVVYENPYKAKMAMKIAGKYRFREVHARHWRQLSLDIGFRADFIEQLLLTLADQIINEAYELLLPKGSSFVMRLESRY